MADGHIRVSTTERTHRLVLVPAANVQWAVQCETQEPVVVESPPGQHEQTARRLVDSLNSAEQEMDTGLRWTVLQRVLTTPWVTR